MSPTACGVIVKIMHLPHVCLFYEVEEKWTVDEQGAFLLVGSRETEVEQQQQLDTF